MVKEEDEDLTPQRKTYSDYFELCGGWKSVFFWTLIFIYRRIFWVGDFNNDTRLIDIQGDWE